jgi:pSer/pThr/pTyr-binding forkhead associated (FHA) protein
MATLTFFLPDGTESPFTLSGELSVGREVGNDVVLPEGGLSRKHCRFFEEGGQVLVEDLGSSNGTFVDGERIEEATPVRAGQEILVANIAVQLSAASGAPKRQPSAVRKAAGSSARTGTMNSPVAGKKPVRALPAPAGRPGSGGRPASAIARRGGGAATALAEEAPAESGAPSARAVLRGQTGPWAGKRYPLSKVVSVIGRVEGNDVVVDDDSVSRRHAEVRKSGPGYAVHDLNSANGTFVNGERVTEAPLRPGDVLKFGVVEFSYSGPSLGALKGGPGGGMDPARRKKLLLYGGIGLASVLLLGVIVHELVTPPPPVEGSGVTNTPAQNAAPDVGQLLGMCRSFADPDGNTLDWKRAAEACDAVLKLDPINDDARKLKKLSEKEGAEKALFDHAHELFSLGQEEVAIEEFMKLDSDSFYFAQARSEFRKAAARVKTRFGAACASSDRAGQFDKAWVACKQYEDFASYTGTEEKVQKLFNELQKRFHGKDEWVRPTKYARFLTSVEVGSDKRLEAIRKLYPEPDLAAAVNLFARDLVAGRNALIRYRDSGKDAVRGNRLIQAADICFSKHQAAYEKMLHDDLKNAAEDVQREIEADHQIMPKDYEADSTEKDRDDIADKYAAKAKSSFGQGRYDESYRQCAAGGVFTKASIAVNSCFADLENYAASIGMDRCEAADQVSRITRPESALNKQAQTLHKTNKCP